MLHQLRGVAQDLHRGFPAAHLSPRLGAGNWFPPALRPHSLGLLPLSRQGGASLGSPAAE